MRVFQTTENKTEGSKAESLMIAGLFVVYGREYIELCRKLNKTREAERAENHVNTMVEAVNKYGWDGEWFLRAYDYFEIKSVLMKMKKEKFSSNPMDGVQWLELDWKRAWWLKLLDSVKERLDCEHGIVLNNPAFTKYHIEYGEISTYPAGYKENASIFCHNNPWIIIGETLLGRGDRAWEYFGKFAHLILSISVICTK